uniref:kynurenine 3-monooxygenase-like n=1 Tax=Styela clava TaxID=7725 RepID=UPI00193A11B9|nr:kynurenine 3-monooxygenase-like [Styela clava]
MDYSQYYIDLGYKEFHIPSSPDGDYSLNLHNGHMWPRKQFLIAAFPNLDKTFTSTIVMPRRMYEEINNEDDVIYFFNKHFKDLIPLICEANLRSSFFKQAPKPLVSVKCSHFHYGKTTVILGDAAHAMTVFSGQGVNCGLKDALIFDQLMEEFDCNFKKVLPAFF